MRIFKYLIAIWTAIAVYTVFSFLGGPRGIPAYNYLLSEREQQRANLEELWHINEELEKIKNNLLYDHDTLLVHARQLGFGYEDERFIRIVGLGNIRPAPAMTGKIYTASIPDFISDKNIKIAAICISFMIFAMLLMIEFIEYKSR
jgi:cell division protein FtsB